MSANSVDYSEKNEYDEQLIQSEFERFQQGMDAEFFKLFDEMEQFPQQNGSSSRDNIFKNKERVDVITRRSENALNSNQQNVEKDTDDDQTHDVWDDVASSIETGMPHPDLDGISFHSDIDIYGELVDEENRSSSDSWERHLDDVDDDYKLRPPRKKTSGSVISVQSVGNYFLSKSFPVSDFDDVMNSQKFAESISMDDLSITNDETSYQSLLQSRFAQLPVKLNKKIEYNIQEAPMESEDEQHSISHHDNSISSPENISISEAISSSSQDQQIPQVKKEFKYAISPESLLFECRSLRGKLTSKKSNINIYNPSPEMAITYQLDSLNGFLLFSSLSGSIPEQSLAVLSIRLNINAIRQQYKDLKNDQQVASDKLLVFIDDMPPSELEVAISLDRDTNLCIENIRNTDFKKEHQQISTFDSCCKFCNVEKSTEVCI